MDVPSILCMLDSRKLIGCHSFATVKTEWQYSAWTSSYLQREIIVDKYQMTGQTELFACDDSQFRYTEVAIVGSVKTVEERSCE